MNKDNLQIVVLGSTAAGKATAVSRLISNGKEIGNSTLTNINDLGNQSLNAVFDRLKSETFTRISSDSTDWTFESSKFNIDIMDAPIHNNFVKNMISGASKANSALLIIDSSPEGFDLGLSKNGLTRDQCIFSYNLGIKQMIIAVNKMDIPTVNFSEVRFNEIKDVLLHLLLEIGFDAEMLHFAPVSCLNGDNVIEKSQNMIWWNGGSLIQSFDLLKLPETLQNKPLRLPLQDVYKIEHNKVVPVGRVESGVLKHGMNVVFAPSDFTSKVKCIEHKSEEVSEAFPGYNVGFEITNISELDAKRGYVVGDPKNDPPVAAKSFVAHVIFTQHPGTIMEGYTPLVECHMAHIPCRFDCLLQRIDTRSGKVLEERPRFIKEGDSCIVKIVPLKPFVCESFSDYPSLGRFGLREMRSNVGIGIILSVEKHIPGPNTSNSI